MKVVCLMGTYGRYSLACESLASFLQQTALDQAHMVILNQHPIPLSFDHPRVTVYNEQMPGAGVRKIRLRMIQLADPTAEYLHFWDDDDLYLPWHLEDCLREIGDSPAWQPAQSWVNWERSLYTFFPSYEASVIFNAQVLRDAPGDINPHLPDHPVFKQLEAAGQLAKTELGGLTSYIYRIHSGAAHMSSEFKGTAEEYAKQIEEIRTKLIDAGPTTMVVPDLWPYWESFLNGVAGKVTPATLVELEARLSLADAMSKLGAGGGT